MWSDNETTEDLLGFKVHAELIADVIKDDTILPVTIGVFGDWGSGKSSILKIIHKELQLLKDDTFVLYFNGWLFEGYDDAKAALLEAIIKEFEQNKKFGTTLKDKTEKLLKSVDWMRVARLGLKNVALPIASVYFTGGISLVPQLVAQFKDMKPDDIISKLQGENAEKFIKDLIKEKDSADRSMMVREFREGFFDLISASKINKLAVIIDDLDRCTHERIIENLEAIKLFLNVEKTAFIIGADPRIVRHAIEYRYKDIANEKGERNVVDDYLEKLIQIPYNLPKLSDSEVETYISLLMAKSALNQEAFQKVLQDFDGYRNKNRYSVFGMSNIKQSVSEEEYKSILLKLNTLPALAPIITQSLYGNPRQIKRFLNTFILRKRLADVAHISGFSDAILAKLMVLEYTELDLFKSLYNWQITQDGIAKELKDLEEIGLLPDKVSIKEKLDKKKYSHWKKDKVISWIKVEPQLNNVDLRDYFWISRDRLTSTIPGTSLIAPFVKIIFQKLNQDNLPGAVIKKIIDTDVKILNEVELGQLLQFAYLMLIKNKDSLSYYKIFNRLVEEKVDGSEDKYKEVLESITNNGLPPAVGTMLNSINASEDFKIFLTNYFKDNKSKASKAFKL